MVALRIAHEQGEVGEAVGILGIFHGDEHRLVLHPGVLLWLLLLGQDDMLGGIFRHEAGDDAGEEDHDDDAVEHLVAEEILARGYLDAQSHHHHGDGSGSMGGGEAKHQVASLAIEAQEPSREIGCQGLAGRAEEGDAGHDQEDASTLEEQVEVDEHTHADEEIGDEEGVARKLQTVHQRRDLRDEAVEDQSSHKGTEDALQANHLGERATEKEDAQDKNKLHDRIAIAAQKPACQSGDEEDRARTVGRKLHGKP